MKSLKSLFVWILLLALPLQGFAAVSMSMCNMGSARIEASAAASGCEHHKAAQPAGDEQSSGMAKCSTCASCSVGAAIATALPVLPQSSSHGMERIPYVSAYDTDCIYGALERPPHTVA
jgi:hypothetical protein